MDAEEKIQHWIDGLANFNVSECIDQAVEPFRDEIVADNPTTDEAYLADISSERPSRQALARELYLRCHPALAHIEGLIPALREALGR